MTGCPVSLVEVGGIGDVEEAHEFLEVGARGFQEEMKMRVHEDEGDEVYAIDINETMQEIKKPASVKVGAEDTLSSVPSTGDAVTRILILNPERSGHEEMLQLQLFTTIILLINSYHRAPESR
jgi:hypothetical protein